eukprot:gene27177-biopygen7140
MNSGVRDRNRAGIKSADPAHRIGMMLGKQTGRVIARCGKGGVRLYPAFGMKQKQKRDRQLRFQLDPGREHPLRGVSSSENGHCYNEMF